jgi:DNA-binding NarL/FixJ family response regulator
VTRVLIADDDDLMRAGLAELLTFDPAIEVAGQAATGREAVEQARRLAPDVVLMDVRMPDLDGIAATRELARVAPRVRVLILTTFEQDDYVFGALRAGASGFLLKRTRPEDLLAAVHTIAAGDSLLSPSVTRRVIDRMAQQPTPELDGQDPREADPDEAGAPRPGPSRDLRLRNRSQPPCRRRQANTPIDGSVRERRRASAVGPAFQQASEPSPLAFLAWPVPRWQGGPIQAGTTAAEGCHSHKGSSVVVGSRRITVPERE